MMPGDRFFTRIGVALLGATLIGGIIDGSGALFRVKYVPKGWKAPYTMRAPCDIVWNQQEMRALDVRGFVPIYDALPGVLEVRRRDLLAEVAKLAPSYWRLPTDPEDELELATESRAPEGDERVAKALAISERLFDLVEPYYQDGVIADAESSALGWPVSIDSASCARCRSRP
jgi:hypothetical protein